MVLTAGLLAAPWGIAEAQVSLEYTRRTRNSTLRVGFSGYSFSGYGYGWEGLGWGGGFGPGIVGTWGGGTYGITVLNSWPAASGAFSSGYGLYAYRSPYGSLYGAYGPRFLGPWRRPAAPSDYFPPRPLTRGVADRIPEYASAREIEEGRRRLTMGDYRGAVEEFRQAVAAHLDNPLAQAYFALGLAMTGDARNADKALREAVERGPLGAIDPGPLFRDSRERARGLARLEKLAESGSLAAAWVLHLAGEADRLKALAETDSAARRLID